MDGVLQFLVRSNHIVTNVQNKVSRQVQSRFRVKKPIKPSCLVELARTPGAQRQSVTKTGPNGCFRQQSRRLL